MDEAAAFLRKEITRISSPEEDAMAAASSDTFKTPLGQTIRPQLQSSEGLSSLTSSSSTSSSLTSFPRSPSNISWHDDLLLSETSCSNEDDMESIFPQLLEDCNEFTCSLCGDRFKTVDELKSHVATHEMGAFYALCTADKPLRGQSQMSKEIKSPIKLSLMKVDATRWRPRTLTMKKLGDFKLLMKSASFVLKKALRPRRSKKLKLLVKASAQKAWNRKPGTPGAPFKTKKPYDNGTPALELIGSSDDQDVDAEMVDNTSPPENVKTRAELKEGSCSVENTGFKPDLFAANSTYNSMPSLESLLDIAPATSQSEAGKEHLLNAVAVAAQVDTVYPFTCVCGKPFKTKYTMQRHFRRNSCQKLCDNCNTMTSIGRWIIHRNKCLRRGPSTKRASRPANNGTSKNTAVDYESYIQKLTCYNCKGGFTKTEYFKHLPCYDPSDGPVVARQPTNYAELVAQFDVIMICLSCDTRFTQLYDLWLHDPAGCFERKAAANSTPDVQPNAATLVVDRIQSKMKTVTVRLVQLTEREIAMHRRQADAAATDCSADLLRAVKAQTLTDSTPTFKSKAKQSSGTGAIAKTRKVLNFECGECKGRFRTGKGLLRHLRNQSCQHLCPAASKSLVMSATRQHLDNQRDTLDYLNLRDNSRRFWCQCRREFSDKLKLESHVPFCRSFKCPRCLKDILVKRQWKNHVESCAIRVPPTTEGLDCNQCKIKFKNCRSSVKHSSVVHGIRERSCFLCKREFSSDQELKDHFVLMGDNVGCILEKP